MILRGTNKPSSDQIAAVLDEYSAAMSVVISRTKGSKKTREMLMVLAAMIVQYGDQVGDYILELPILADRLASELMPRTAAECWGSGAAFSLAMERARKIVGYC